MMSWRTANPTGKVTPNRRLHAPDATRNSQSVSGILGRLVANLMNENIHVSVIDDPVNTPEDPWEVEAYQRENLPSDPAQIFKFATYDIGHIAAEMEGRGLIDELNRMLLVQYFSAIEAYLSIVSSDWCSMIRRQCQRW